MHLREEQASLDQRVVDESVRAVDAAEGIERKGLVLKMLTRLEQVYYQAAQALGELPASPRRPGAAGAPTDAATLATSERRSHKLARLCALLDEALAAGDAALVFTQYRQMGDLLAAPLATRFDVDVPFPHGGVNAARRAELVRAYQAHDGPPVFLLSLKAGGTGLNLTRGSARPVAAAPAGSLRGAGRRPRDGFGTGLPLHRSRYRGHPRGRRRWTGH